MSSEPSIPFELQAPVHQTDLPTPETPAPPPDALPQPGVPTMNLLDMGEDFLGPAATGSRLGRGIAILTASIILALCLTNIALLVANTRKPPPFNPLGDYPLQVVTLPKEDVRNNGEELPTLHYTFGHEVIPVKGVKCNASDSDVLVVGSSRWRLVEPPGTFIETPGGQATRKPGCTTFDYKNPIPQGVKDRLVQLHQNGVDVSVWQILGTDEPISPEGDKGVIKYWQSEVFAIDYQAGPA